MNRQLLVKDPRLQTRLKFQWLAQCSSGPPWAPDQRTSEGSLDGSANRHGHPGGCAENHLEGPPAFEICLQPGPFGRPPKNRRPAQRRMSNAGPVLQWIALGTGLKDVVSVKTVVKTAAQAADRTLSQNCNQMAPRLARSSAAPARRTST